MTDQRGEQAWRPIERESIEDALENDRCGICYSVDHFREDYPAPSAGQSYDFATVDAWVRGWFARWWPDADAEARQALVTLAHTVHRAALAASPDRAARQRASEGRPPCPSAVDGTTRPPGAPGDQLPRPVRGEAMPATPIRMTVTDVTGAVVRLSHEVEDEERHDDGYTGAELHLWYRDVEVATDEEGWQSSRSDDEVAAMMPLAVGQVVTVTIAPTDEGRPVERLVDEDGDGIPDRRHVTDPPNLDGPTL